MPEPSQGNTRCATKPLRIIAFTTDFLPGPGGVQKHIFLFAAGLAKEGQHTTVVTESAAAGFDDTALPFPVLRRVGLFRLVRLIASADIIHLAGPPFIPLLIGFLLGKPIVIEHHGYHAICPNGLLLFEPDRSACSGHFIRREYAECCALRQHEPGTPSRYLAVAACISAALALPRPAEFQRHGFRARRAPPPVASFATDLPWRSDQWRTVGLWCPSPQRLCALPM